MREAFFYRRFIRPVMDLLRQGTSPEKIALSIAFGLVLGVFPGIGWTTLLCTVAAIRFGLNLPAVQLVNYFAYPLQLALLIPFVRAGEFLFRAEKLPLSLSQILNMVRSDMWHSIKVLWVVTLHAMAVWLILAPPAIYLIYRLLSPVVRRMARVAGVARPDVTERLTTDEH
ncbi:MAG TPA: DUF2062 domain-containing protein [Candidatus Saccharimonadales bacterium]|nr:DUF2062 domain-containing protein [Candidatus Saccharimonadales bacterium]